MTSQIQIRKCTALPDFHRCVEIQKSVWNESDLETEPYTTFVVANQTRGQVLGPFHAPTLAGFTIALARAPDKAPYPHPHTPPTTTPRTPNPPPPNPKSAPNSTPGSPNTTPPPPSVSPPPAPTISSNPGPTSNPF